MRLGVARFRRRIVHDNVILEDDMRVTLIATWLCFLFATFPRWWKRLLDVSAQELWYRGAVLVAHDPSLDERLSDHPDRAAEGPTRMVSLRRCGRLQVATGVCFACCWRLVVTRAVLLARRRLSVCCWKGLVPTTQQVAIVKALLLHHRQRARLPIAAGV